MYVLHDDSKHDDYGSDNHNGVGNEYDQCDNDQYDSARDYDKRL